MFNIESNNRGDVMDLIFIQFFPANLEVNETKVLLYI